MKRVLLVVVPFLFMLVLMVPGVVQASSRHAVRSVSLPAHVLYPGCGSSPSWQKVATDTNQPESGLIMVDNVWGKYNSSTNQFCGIVHNDVEDGCVTQANCVYANSMLWNYYSGSYHQIGNVQCGPFRNGAGYSISCNSPDHSVSSGNIIHGENQTEDDVTLQLYTQNTPTWTAP